LCNQRPQPCRAKRRHQRGGTPGMAIGIRHPLPSLAVTVAR
jgi:hypothetical protein